MQIINYNAIARKVLLVGALLVTFGLGGAWFTGLQNQSNTNGSAQPQANSSDAPSRNLETGSAQPTAPSQTQSNPNDQSSTDNGASGPQQGMQTQTGHYSRTWSSNVNGQQHGSEQAWAYDDQAGGWQQNTNRSW